MYGIFNFQKGVLKTFPYILSISKSAHLLGFFLDFIKECQKKEKNQMSINSLVRKLFLVKLVERE